MWDANRDLISSVFFEQLHIQFKNEQKLESDLINAHEAYQKQIEKLLKEKQDLKEQNKKHATDLAKLLKDQQYMQKRHEKAEMDLIAVKIQFTKIAFDYQQLYKDNVEIKTTKMEQSLIKEYQKDRAIVLNDDLLILIKSQIQPTISKYQSRFRMGESEIKALQAQIDQIIESGVDARTN